MKHYENEIIGAILNEVIRAEEKHPNWPEHDIVHCAAIVAEECGELIRAAVQYEIDGIHSADVSETIKKECIQTAAMCVRLLKHFNLNLRGL